MVIFVNFIRSSFNWLRTRKCLVISIKPSSINIDSMIKCLSAFWKSEIICYHALLNDLIGMCIDFGVDFQGKFEFFQSLLPFNGWHRLTSIWDTLRAPEQKWKIQQTTKKQHINSELLFFLRILTSQSTFYSIDQMDKQTIKEFTEK